MIRCCIRSLILIRCKRRQSKRFLSQNGSACPPSFISMLVILGVERCDFFTNENRSVCAYDQVVQAKLRSPVKSNNLLHVLLKKNMPAGSYTQRLLRCAHALIYIVFAYMRALYCRNSLRYAPACRIFPFACWDYGRLSS